jgi:predicted dehydrogenase
MRSGLIGSVEFSRVRDLTNRWVLQFEHGAVEFGPEFGTRVELSLAHGNHLLAGTAAPRNSVPPTSIIEAFRAQFADFVRAIDSHTQPVCSGADATRSIALIEHCYANRKSCAPSWQTLLNTRVTESAI